MSETRPRLRRMGGVLCIAAALAIFIAAGLPDRAVVTGWQTPAQAGTPARVIAPEVGALAPDFDLRRLGEPGTVRLNRLRGRAVVVNFWATWCVPCAVEMPDLARIADVYGERVAVVGVNVGEDPAYAAAWAQARGIGYPLVSDGDGTLSLRWAVRGQPTTFILTDDGTISAVTLGPMTYGDLVSALSRIGVFTPS